MFSRVALGLLMDVCQAPGKKAGALLKALVDEQKEIDTRVHVNLDSKLQVCLPRMLHFVYTCLVMSRTSL